MGRSGRKRSVLVGFFSFCAALMLSPLASATQWYPASAGVGLTIGSQQCFSEYYGSETNTCSSWQYWIIPVHATGNAYLEPSIRVYGPDPSHTVGCYAYVDYAYGANQFQVIQTNVVYPSQFGTVMELQPTGNGFMQPDMFGQIVCMVYPGATVYGVNY